MTEPGGGRRACSLGCSIPHLGQASEPDRLVELVRLRWHGIGTSSTGKQQRYSPNLSGIYLGCFARALMPEYDAVPPQDPQLTYRLLAVSAGHGDQPTQEGKRGRPGRGGQ